MKRAAWLYCLCILLVGTVDGLAGTRYSLNSQLSEESAYVAIINNETGLDETEDVTYQERLSTDLVVNNPYFRLGTHYSISRVRFANNDDLNYREQRLNLNLNLDGLMSRLVRDGRVEIITDFSLSPSLPELESSRWFRELEQPGIDDPMITPEGELVRSETELFAESDLVNVQDETDGYSLHYGIFYNGTWDPLARYRAGWEVNETRYDSPLVADTALLKVSGSYIYPLLRSSTAVNFVFRRYIRDTGTNQRSYGLSMSWGREAFRYGWQLSPGMTYLTKEEQLKASISAQGMLRGRRLTVNTDLNSDWSAVNLGNPQLGRVHRASLAIRPTRHTRTPFTLSVSGYLAERSLRYSGGVRQSFPLWRSANVTLSYAHTVAHTDDTVLPYTVERQSDRVSFLITWRFI